MMDATTIPANNMSFKDFLFKDKRNRTILILAAIAIVIQFSVFKYFYPFANYIHDDSYSYIDAANINATINTYLIGYSKFLRLFSVFAKPDYMLVAFQYLFIQSSVLFLLFTLFYFYKIGNIFQAILLGFMVFNPLFLHLANMISSDGVFLALSCIWFALILWIIYRPSTMAVVIHAIIVFVAFTVRYNAIIYPIISGLAFYLSKLSIRKKLVGIGLMLLLCGWFIGLTMFQYKKLTGYWQYSPFSGWQLANNAMYTYRYVDSAERKQVPPKYQLLDKMIREYFDSTRDHKKYYYEDWMASTVYMWTPTLSLYKYRNQLFKKDTSATELKKWASMGPFYKEYGLYIIGKYPIKFLRYFVWPNANKYYAPPIEFFEFYNGNSTVINKVTMLWFGYKNQTIKSRFKMNKIWVLNFYPILSGLINLSMVCLLIFFLVLKGWEYKTTFNRGLFIGTVLWISNAIFTIFASSAALRFQSFPIVLTVIFVTLLTNWMFQMMHILQQENSNNSQEAKDIKVEIITDASF